MARLAGEFFEVLKAQKHEGLVPGVAGGGAGGSGGGSAIQLSKVSGSGLSGSSSEGGSKRVTPSMPMHSLLGSYGMAYFPPPSQVGRGNTQ